MTVVTRTNPVCTRIRASGPVTTPPDVTRSNRIVVTTDPGVTRTGGRRRISHDRRWRWGRIVAGVITSGTKPDEKASSGKDRAPSQEQNREQLRFHNVLLRYLSRKELQAVCQTINY